MAALHGSADIPIENKEVHEFETSAQEFIELNDWHVVATDKNDLEEGLTVNEHQEPPHMNIMSITGIARTCGAYQSLCLCLDMSCSSITVITSFRAYVMLLTKGSLPSLFVSGVSRQVSSMLSD